MTDLFNRSLKLQVDKLAVEFSNFHGLRVAFKAVRSLKPKTPNSCDITVYNLSETSRALIAGKNPIVTLSVGYGTDLTQLYFGQALRVSTEHKGTEYVTTITSTDGGEDKQKKRIAKSFGPGTNAATVLRAITDALGVKPGNLSTVLAQLRASSAAQLYSQGVTLVGNAARELDAICQSAGFEWSIQDGALQILDLNKSLAQFAISLTPETGLVGSPSLGSDGVLSGQALLIKDFLPGRQVQVETSLVRAAGRLTKCTYQGDTYSDQWTVDFEAETKAKK